MAAAAIVRSSAASAAGPSSLAQSPIGQTYVDAIQLIERLNAGLLDVIKDELDRHGEREVNNVQALLLFHIGDRQLTAGELRARGCYLGSNVSHNLKKLVDTAYVRCERCETDRRAVLVSLAAKGERIRDLVARLFAHHLESFEAASDVGGGDLESMNGTLRRMEQFWINSVRFRL